MTHIAIQEAVDGKNVNWLERVTDEQYFRPQPALPQAVIAGRQLAARSGL